MNRSAKDGAGRARTMGAKAFPSSPVVPRCLRAARYGRFMRDLRRPVGVLAVNQVSDPISGSELGSDASTGVGERNRALVQIIRPPIFGLSNEQKVVRWPGFWV